MQLSRLLLIVFVHFVVAAPTFVSTDVLADVVRIQIDSRVDLNDAQPFESRGVYEQIDGLMFFEFDPANEFDQRIVDLKMVPVNERGKVQGWANFRVMQAKDPARRSGIALMEVSNRGGVASLSYFNRGRLSPNSNDVLGDGFLMKLGLTVVWVGWQWDVPSGRGSKFFLDVPFARNEDGSSITGLVRADWVIDRATRELNVGHRNHIAYPILDPDSPLNLLTVRDRVMGERTQLARELWSWGHMEGNEIVDDKDTIVLLDSEFSPGRIYELVYPSYDPRVVGLGLAAIRDAMSYIKYDPNCEFSAQTGVAFGASQTGRFLRHFIYQGFNTDEHGRKVYDGMLIHTAGAGRGSFNHRFAQPSRDAHRYSSFFYPTDLFPFTGAEQTDSETGETDGLFSHMFDDEHLPKIFYTNTGYEYWGRGASLIHTSIDGLKDIDLLPNERAFHLAGGQHFIGPWPVRPSSPSYDNGVPMFRGNPVDFLKPLRALLVHLCQWAKAGVAPPESKYPTIAGGTLVTPDELNFPLIPGLETPLSPYLPRRLDFGPRWKTEGIIDNEPPVAGAAYGVRVPQVDGLGNEIGGLLPVELLVPLATFTPWSLRTGLPGETEEMLDFLGNYVPLPRTEEDRERLGDPRPSIESLYGTREAYLERVKTVVEEQMAERLLTFEDGQAAFDRAVQHWDWIMAGKMLLPPGATIRRIDGGDAPNTDDNGNDNGGG